MTSGIYLLKFKGTSKVYVGQSCFIEKRFTQHIYSLNIGLASKKLNEAFISFGVPSYEILLMADATTNLDLEEETAIAIWDSVDNGFNTYYYANEAPTHKEYGSGNTKYSKDVIIDIMVTIITTDFSYAEISKIFNVSPGTISGIGNLTSHLWLNKEFPKEYLLLVEKHMIRKTISNNIVSNKLSAKSKGIIYPKIKSPSGEIFSIDNAYSFAKQRGLAPNHFQEVLNGHRKSHKGWKICLEEVPL